MIWFIQLAMYPWILGNMDISKYIPIYPFVHLSKYPCIWFILIDKLSFCLLITKIIDTFGKFCWYQKSVVSTHPRSLSKVLNSLWMGPYLIYFSMSNWIYPLKDYIGETGCYLMNIFRAIHLYEVQLQSFFISLFRFVCLFHSGLLQKISPNVREKHSIHLYLIF